MNKVFSIHAFNWQSSLFLLLMAALPVGITWGAMRLAHASKAGPLALVILLLILPLFIGLLAQLFFVRASIKGSVLRLGGGLYSIDAPLDALKIDQIRIHHGADRPRLGLRSNGIGMPGLALGWFRASGGRRIFAVTTSHAPIVVIPTHLDYDIWASPQQAELFVDRLQVAASKPQ
ncbi:PH domain-containing protein [Pseudoxanthomonas dokdonensis]|uniref:Bacterial Pleckstrin homology domain-containing protein n=1 Tax=Pseudoxanthomonas dokdonensis TaxID=344882 RepID=A0A0R0CZH0_9GAMM|nr:PH domain-containing protein [Pseudoxanthomonas dokdonensis]KRG71582.1 hypothetical protein ABB29_02110 [Pseudoxanthomonas dokdonensis]